MTQLSACISRQRVDPNVAMLRAFVPLIAVVVLAFVMHLLGYAGGPYATRILINCGVAIIAAVSLTIVNGFTGQFSIGHAAFMAVGGYAGGLLTYYFALSHLEPSQIRDLGPTLFGTNQFVLAGACLFGGIVAAAAGWLVGLPSLRLRGDYLAIVTLGFGEIVRVMLQQTPKQLDSHEQFAATLQQGYWWWTNRANGSWWIPFRHGFGSFAPAPDPVASKVDWALPWWDFLAPPATNGSLGFRDLPTVTNLLWTYLFVGITVLVAFRIKSSSYGRALLSIREDEIAAESMGINIAKLKVRAFVIAAFFAGIAGALYAHQPGNLLTPKDAGFIRSFDIVMMVVLGGLGSISGSVLAAIVITLLNTLLVPLGPYRMIIFALMLILTMIFRPQGLFGLREVWELWRRRSSSRTA